MPSPDPSSSSSFNPAPPAFSLSLGSKPKPPARKPPATPFSTKRSAAQLGSDDEVSDDDDAHRGKVQLVSGFDAKKGGALDVAGEGRKTAAPLVIPAQKNRDWKREAEMRKGKKEIYLPPDARQGPLREDDLVETDVTEQKYGLQTFDKDEDAGDSEDTRQEAVQSVEQNNGSIPAAPKTEDELALAALLGGNATTKSDLVIASGNGDADWRNGGMNEDDAYRKDVLSRPEMATLEDYANVPVEQFGAALLRGMGWKEGEEIGKRKKGQISKPRVVEKRPAFLGIGAKAKEEIPELGAWGKSDKKRNKRFDTTYVPVVMVDKKTGKVVDEAKLQANGKSSESTKEHRQSDKLSDRRNGDRDRSRNRNELSRGGRGRHLGRDSSRDRSYRERDRNRDRDRHREKERDRRDDRKDDRRRDGRRDERRDRDSRRRSRDRRHR